MKTEEAIKYFGNQVKLAKALGITKQAVSRWGDTVPVGRAYQLQAVTNGALIAKQQSAA
ncbi:MAG: Cro/CI family transcriptional regulator [Anaerolineae bacterium]|nr:Cro/CI family transcriptional regulator [Anaerolineae bacterium]